MAFRFAVCLSTLRSRAALVFARLASISSFSCLSRAFSALARWICCLVNTCIKARAPLWDCTYVLNEGTLVLEGVTLGSVVQLVVKVLVDLAGGTVLDQQAAENSLTAHPKNLPKILCQPELLVKLRPNIASWNRHFPTTRLRRRLFSTALICYISPQPQALVT